jgi:3D (Asp-Asp-Asp) domain-containing protein
VTAAPPSPTPTPARGTVRITPAYVPPAPELAPFVGNGRPPRRPRRRLGRYASAMLALVLVVTLAAGALRVRDGLEPQLPLAFLPVVVYAPIRLDGALVLGASRDWHVDRDTPLRFGDPVPVELTAYCLKGTTRRDNYVREGIIASDPKMFPLGRYLEIYVGKTYFGRFLIDDTGGVIKGNKLDIWTPTCREARLFGRVKGTAVLVPKPRDAAADTVTTGRLGGAKGRTSG